jgi:phage baseplate assembly protein W|tara:strand:- start:74 stop:451 length:378 start_codon:yes stop_codon:yes gene_type:complete
MAGISPRLPLMLDSVDGPYGLITTYKELATQKLKMLLLTNPGERIMNPDFGVGLKSYFFELAGPDTYAAINDRIVSQVSRYLSFIQIDKIDFSAPEDSPELYPHTLSITIRFTIVPLGSVATLQI